MRAGINLSNFKVVYTTMFQYRHLAEALLDKAISAIIFVTFPTLVANEEMAKRALKIAKFQRYYAYICNNKFLFFLVETIAQDLRILCEVSFKNYGGSNVW